MNDSAGKKSSKLEQVTWIHATNKSDLMACLDALAPDPESVPSVDVSIVDGAAVVHMLDPKKSQVCVKTFQDYAHLVFLP